MLQDILSLSLGSYALFAGSFFILYLIANFIRDPLRDIPGPFLARFTRFWYFIEVYKGSFEVSNIALHKKYGPIVRIAPHQYSIDDVEAARTIYGHGNEFLKSRWYWAWQAPKSSQASLFSDLSASRHSTQRRKFASLYSMSSLIGYEQFVNNCSSLLTQRFSELASSGKVIDFQHWLQCYAFDVIGEITFSNRFGFLDMGQDKEGVFKAIEGQIFYATFVGIFPWVHQYIFPWLPKTGGPAYLTNYALKQIGDRQRSLNDPRNIQREGPPDFVTKILMAHEADPEKVTKADLFTICRSNIGAGSDTTAISLSSIFYNLMKHPQTWHRLQQEIDTASKEGRISDPVTFKEAQELPYLQAVIKEALRMHSATGLPMWRMVPADGAIIAGRFIPGGSTVGINAWVAHRNENVYGQDAEKWRPERWLKIEEQGRAGEVEKYFFAFGMGSRTCIGKNISLLEMSKVVPQLLRNFDMVLDENLEKEGLVSLNRWFVKQQHFNGKVFLRK